MWEYAINIILAAIYECIKRVSAFTYKHIRAKAKREYTTSELLEEISQGRIRVGDRITLVGNFSEYVPLINPAQMLSGYETFRFGTLNPFDKTDGEFDRNYLDSITPGLVKWIADENIEVSPLPTTTIKLKPINDVFCASILDVDQQYAYTKQQVPLFYSQNYNTDNLRIFNWVSGERVSIDCVVVPVPDSFNNVLSSNVPTVQIDYDNSVPIGLKVLKARSIKKGDGVYINHWLIGHFSSRSLSENDIWEQIVWENFLKGNKSINIENLGDEGRKTVLPLFCDSDYLLHSSPLLLKKDGIDHDVYFSIIMIKPSMFQLFFSKSSSIIPHIRKEFVRCANIWMSDQSKDTFSNDTKAEIDFQWDQRKKIWHQKIKDLD